MNLGTRIMNLRKKKRLSQQKLANKLFVTDKTISSWEKNRTEPGLEMIIKLSEVLDCSASYLISGDVNKNDIETEIKVKLSKKEFEELKIYMKNNAKFVSEVRQVDTYYEPTHRRFLNSNPITEWLRIGKRGNKNILNYKNWYSDMSCDEYEVEINNIKDMDKILKVLGMVQIVEVDKIRNSFIYLDKYEVALDNVEKLGYFIEIEIKKYTKTVMEECDELLKLAKGLNLNLDSVDKRGYPYHLLFNEEKI